MFTKTLFGNTKAILAVLGKSQFIKDAYLAGGTACALQLGHRISFDLDFFTPKKFNNMKVVNALERLVNFALEESTEGTVLGNIKDIRFSYFFYQYTLLFSLKRFLGIHILDVRDIAAMKVAAISVRGLKRDFIDLYFICKETNISLGKMLSFYDRKYGKLAGNLLHIKKSLVYFMDAEEQYMPRMLKPCRWEEVKNFFESEVKKIAVKAIR